MPDLNFNILMFARFFAGESVFGSIALVFILLLLVAIVWLLWRSRRRSRQLARSNEELRLSLVAGNVSVWKYDIVHDRIDSLHGSVFILDGATMKECLDTIKPKYREAVTEKINRVVNRQTISDQITIEIFDFSRLSYRYLEMHGIAVVSNGRAIEIIGTHKDITDELTWQQQLSETNAKYEAIFESSAVGLEYYNAYGIMTDINASALKNYGFDDKNVLLAQSPYLYENPNYLLFAKSVEDRKRRFVLNFDYDYDKMKFLVSGAKCNLSGTRRLSIQIVPLVDGNGNVKSTIISSTDVTDDYNRNRRYEELYRKSELIFEALPVGISIFDREGHYTRVNKAFAKFFGIDDAEKFLSRHLSIYASPAVNDTIMSMINERVESQTVLTIDFGREEVHDFYPSTNRGRKSLSCLYRPLYSDTEQFEGFILILSDMTETESRLNETVALRNYLDVALKAASMHSWVFDVENNRFFTLGDSDNRHEHTGIYTMLDRLCPDDVPMVHSRIDMLLNGVVGSTRNEFRLLNPAVEGGYTYNDSYAVSQSRGGRVTALVGTFRDVTDEVRSRRQLEESRRKMMLALKVSNMSMWEFDPERSALSIWDENSEAVVDRMPVSNYLTNIHPDDLSLIDENEKIMNERCVREINCTLRVRDPHNSLWQYKIVSGTPIVNRDGRVERYIGMIRDNTQWVNLASELEESNKLLNVIVDRMPCALFIKDATDDYRYIMSNRLFAECVGSSVSEIEGHTDYELFATEQADAFRRDDVAAVNNVEGQVIKEQTDWGGQHIEWHTRKMQYVSPQGNTLLIGIALDVTDLIASNRDLIEAKERAERSDLLKSAFLANMSHEIRTPLNSIVGFSQLLATTDDQADRANYSKIISTNSDILLALIDDILDLSKIESGYVEFNLSDFDLVEFLNQVYAAFRLRVTPNVELRIVCPCRSCRVSLDRKRLLQLMNNLISNAFKYTAEGSVTIGFTVLSDGVKIYVSDTGIGISEQNKPRVFKRFEKFDTFAQGTGLGLSICKALCDAAGGELGFESQLGVGSTFWAKLHTPVVAEYGRLS